MLSKPGSATQQEQDIFSEITETYLGAKLSVSNIREQSKIMQLILQHCRQLNRRLGAEEVRLIMQDLETDREREESGVFVGKRFKEDFGTSGQTAGESTCDLGMEQANLLPQAEMTHPSTQCTDSISTARGNSCRHEGAPQQVLEEDDSSGSQGAGHQGRQHSAVRRPRERGGGLTGRRRTYRRRDGNGGGPRQKRSVHSNKSKRSQARKEKWKKARDDEELKHRYRDFHKGAEAFGQRIQVTDKDIKEAMSTLVADGRHLEQVPVAAVGQEGARTAELQELQRMMQLLRDGGYGYLPEQKQSGNV